MTETTKTRMMIRKIIRDSNANKERIVDADLLIHNIMGIKDCCAKSDPQKTLVDKILLMIASMTEVRTIETNDQHSENAWNDNANNHDHDRNC